MESKERPIIISSTRAQKKYILKSKATNLAELKEECRNAGIDYEGLTFVEAITNTEMRGDNSLLPKEVVYKGKTTDNIVFSLTNPRKNIGSGMDRKEAYSLIKMYDLGDVCKKVYGENYTRVSTANLEALINQRISHTECEEESKESETQETVATPIDYTQSCENNPMEVLKSMLEQALAIVNENLNKSVALNESDIDSILNAM